MRLYQDRRAARLGNDSHWDGFGGLLETSVPASMSGKAVRTPWYSTFPGLVSAIFGPA
jgi:hypothetical protein